MWIAWSAPHDATRTEYDEHRLALGVVKLTFFAKLITRVAPVARHTDMPALSRIRILLILLLAGQPAAILSAARSDGWELLAQFLYRDAAEAFAADPAGGRLRNLGWGAALLNEPPLTDAKIARAEELLQRVADGQRDDTAWYARYLLARIVHVHRLALVAEAESAYRALVAEAPGTAAAQLSAAQLALLLLYQRPDLDVPARLDAAAALAPVAGDPARPDIAAAFFQQLASAAMFYRVTDERVLAWLEQAHAIGLSNQLDQSTLSLQVAETARALGQTGVAEKYYRQFLATAAATDQRYYTAELRLQELGGEGDR